MKRRTLLLAPLIALGLPTLAHAEPQSLAVLSEYINSLTLAETEFLQTNADGTTVKGRIFIRRPNRMRFEYAAPNDALVLASAGTVAIFDAKSNEPPEKFPLKRTPLNLILGRDVDLGKARLVTDHVLEGELTRVTAQDPEHPEYGSIALYFDDSPKLVKWVVRDDLGQETQVELGDLRAVADFPTSLFSIDTEMQRRGLN